MPKKCGARSRVLRWSARAQQFVGASSNQSYPSEVKKAPKTIFLALLLGQGGCQNAGPSISQDLSGTSSTTAQSDLTGFGMTTTSPTMAFESSTSLQFDASSGTSSSETGTGTTDGGSELKCGNADECDVWKQDCPAGLKCTACSVHYPSQALDSNRCLPVAVDPIPLGGNCTVEGDVFSGLDDCGSDAYCAYNAIFGTKVCQAFCGGTPQAPECAIGSFCVGVWEGLPLCFPFCDPLLQDCGEESKCIFADGALVCVGVTGTDAGLDETCDSSFACQKGLLCAPPDSAAGCDPNGTGCCQPFCHVGMDDCAGEGQECIALYAKDAAPPGFESVGVCSIP